MEHIVYVVDDDDAVRQSVLGLLESADLDAMGFSSAEAFLQHRFEDLPSCVILDMQMPAISGFDVADALKDSGRDIPIIFLTGHGTIPMSVRAIKGGAYEFLTKPVLPDELINSVADALALAEKSAVLSQEKLLLTTRYHSLTPREKELMQHILRGLLNKQIASEMEISEITAKVHKRRVLDKMVVRSVPELIRAAEKLGILHDN